MSTAATSAGRATLTTVRRALLGLAAAGVVLTGVELAMLRHWGTLNRNIPWFVLAVTAVAIAALAVSFNRRIVIAARLVGVVIAASSVYGIIQHVIANHDAGPLDGRYADTWNSMSALTQWWKAATETVGPTPPLAPAALALGGVCLWLATIGHPARSRR